MKQLSAAIFSIALISSNQANASFSMTHVVDHEAKIYAYYEKNGKAIEDTQSRLLNARETLVAHKELLEKDSSNAQLIAATKKLEDRIAHLENTENALLNHESKALELIQGSIKTVEQPTYVRVIKGFGHALAGAFVKTVSENLVGASLSVFIGEPLTKFTADKGILFTPLKVIAMAASPKGK